MLLEVFAQLAHWAAKGRGKASGIQLSLNYCKCMFCLIKKTPHMAHGTVVSHNTSSVSHLPLCIHLKQAMKSIAKKEPVTDINQMYSLQSKIKWAGEKAVLWFSNASFLIPSLFSETSRTVKQTDTYWWGEKTKNVAFLTYFVYSFPIISALQLSIF